MKKKEIIAGIIVGILFLTAMYFINRMPGGAAEEAFDGAGKAESAETLVMSGTEKFYNKDYAQSLKYFNKAIKLDKNNKDLYFFKGVILYMTGKYGESVKAYDKAIKLAPETPQLYSNKGLAYTKMGKYKKALAEYEKALNMNFKDAVVFYGMMEAQIFSGDFSAALGNMEQYLQFGGYIYEDDYDAIMKKLEKSADENAQKIMEKLSEKTVRVPR